MKAFFTTHNSIFCRFPPAFCFDTGFHSRIKQHDEAMKHGRNDAPG